MYDASGIVEAAAGAGIAMYALGGMGRVAAPAGGDEEAVIDFADKRGYELVEAGGDRLVFEKRDGQTDVGSFGGVSL